MTPDLSPKVAMGSEMYINRLKRPMISSIRDLDLAATAQATRGWLTRSYEVRVPTRLLPLSGNSPNEPRNARFENGGIVLDFYHGTNLPIKSRRKKKMRLETRRIFRNCHRRRRCGGKKPFLTWKKSSFFIFLQRSNMSGKCKSNNSSAKVGNWARVTFRVPTDKRTCGGARRRKERTHDP